MFFIVLARFQSFSKDRSTFIGGQYQRIDFPLDTLCKAVFCNVNFSTPRSNRLIMPFVMGGKACFEAVNHLSPYAQSSMSKEQEYVPRYIQNIITVSQEYYQQDNGVVGNLASSAI